MSRELLRVPVDFEWPIGKVWSGYISPYRFPACPTCGPMSRDAYGGAGDGLSRPARAIHETFYPHQIGGGRRAEDLAWCDKLGQVEVDHLVAKGRLRKMVDGRWTSVPRTADEVNEAELRHMIHDGINRNLLVTHRCELLGIPMACETCDGHGTIASEADRRASEEWKGQGPPTGAGWQIWETVSSGSAASPVFPTSEALIAWMVVDHPERPFQWTRMSREGAKEFVRKGWVPSGVGDGHGGFEPGLEHLDRVAQADVR